jgi:hypothetical protein
MLPIWKTARNHYMLLANSQSYILSVLVGLKFIVILPTEPTFFIVIQVLRVCESPILMIGIAIVG